MNRVAIGMLQVMAAGVLAACGTTNVKWNEHVLRENLKSAGSHPPVVVVPSASRASDPRDIYERIAMELEESGFRVRRSASDEGTPSPISPSRSLWPTRK